MEKGKKSLIEMFRLIELCLTWTATRKLEGHQRWRGLAVVGQVVDFSSSAGTTVLAMIEYD